MVSFFMKTFGFVAFLFWCS